MNFRTTDNPANAMVNNSAGLPASGAAIGVEYEFPVTITMASIARPRDIFGFCIY
jgi:hypothetical protein